MGKHLKPQPSFISVDGKASSTSTPTLFTLPLGQLPLDVFTLSDSLTESTL